MKIQDEFDYILEENLVEISNTLIRSIDDSPYYMEVKLRIIEPILPLLTFNTIIELLQTFENLIDNCKTQPSFNILACNTNIQMTILTIQRIALKITKLAPRTETRAAQIN